MTPTRLFTRLTLTLAALLLLLAAQPAFAQKKPGSGGPPGIIYFAHDATIWTMNADGSNRQPVPGTPQSIDAFPSFERHAGVRWFTSRLRIDWGEFFPNDHGYLEIWAINAETGDSVPLVAASDLNLLSQGIWLPDDRSVCFFAQRWWLDEGEPVEVVEAGLYEVAIAYDTNGALLGAVPDSLSLIAELTPEMRIKSGAFSVNGNDFVNGITWSPDLSTCAFGFNFLLNQQSIQELWMLDVTQLSDPLDIPSTALMLFKSGNGVGSPQWSPDGRRLAHYSSAGPVIHDLTRNKTKVLQHGATFSWGVPRWSPDGAHCVLYRYDNFTGYDGLYRFTADLSGKTKISGTLCEDAQPFRCTLFPVGWRD